MSTANCPHRQFSRVMRPIGTVQVGVDIAPIVDDICRRIRRMRGGGHLLADRSGNVFVLADCDSKTAHALRAHTSHVVAGYVCKGEGKPVLDVERVRMDLIGHLCRIGIVNIEAIYGQEGRGNA
jgi:hypothetical protein